MISFAGILILGFFLGMRHATDPDHVIAVMTIVTKQRGLAKAGVIGALTGCCAALVIPIWFIVRLVRATERS